MNLDKATQEESKRLSKQQNRRQKKEDRQLKKLSSMQRRCADKVALIGQLYLQEKTFVRGHEVNLASATLDGGDYALVLSYDGSFFFRAQWGNCYTLNTSLPEHWELLTKVATRDIFTGMARAKLRYVST